MALFKINKGLRESLNSVSLTEGWAYFTPDTGEFFIDAKVAPSAGATPVLTRIPLNATGAKYDWEEVFKSSTDSTKKTIHQKYLRLAGGSMSGSIGFATGMGIWQTQGTTGQAAIVGWNDGNQGQLTRNASIGRKVEYTANSQKGGVWILPYNTNTDPGTGNAGLMIAYKQLKLDGKYVPYLTSTTSTDNAIPKFDGTTGNLQDTGVTIDDDNAISAPGGFKGTATNATNAATADKAKKLIKTDGTDYSIGATVTPVYFSNGVPVTTGYSFTSTSPLGSTNETTIPTSKAVADAISASFAANDAMIFKGTLSSSSNVPKSGYKIGFTYKINAAGTYAGKTCEIGDLLIAIADAASGQTAVNNDHWTVAQGNINGAVTLPVVSGTITMNVGTADKPVYIKDGVVTATSHDLSSYLLLSGGAMSGTLYFGSTTYYIDKSGNAVFNTVKGSTSVTTPSVYFQDTDKTHTVRVYSNNNLTSNLTLQLPAFSGHIVGAKTDDVGASATPVYLVDRELKACGYKFTDYLPLAGGTMTGAINFGTDGYRITAGGEATLARVVITPGNDITATNVDLKVSGGADIGKNLRIGGTYIQFKQDAKEAKIVYDKDKEAFNFVFV